MLKAPLQPPTHHPLLEATLWARGEPSPLRCHRKAATQSPKVAGVPAFGHPGLRLHRLLHARAACAAAPASPAAVRAARATAATAAAEQPAHPDFLARGVWQQLRSMLKVASWWTDSSLAWPPGETPSGSWL